MPPDTAVVPPTVAAFSNTSTEAPAAAAVNAAVSPAPPLPSTTTSTSWSQDTPRYPFSSPSAHLQLTHLQLNSADNWLAALMTASLPRITTSSRWEMRLMQVGGDGAWRWTAPARPEGFGS